MKTGIIWHPVSFVTEPQSSMVLVIRNSWWQTNEKGEVAIFGKYHPRCNSDKTVMEILRRPDEPDEFLFIPLAFVDLDLGRY